MLRSWTRRWPRARARPGAGAPRRAFTLIELLVVLAIVALLASLAVPSYFSHVERTRETVLQENLHRIRDALDTFHADLGRYPESLDELVNRRYLRAIPPDPITGKTTTWVVAPPPAGVEGKVGDIHSGAPGNGRDGKAYASW